MTRYDVALISDPRFKGGTRSAIKADIEAFQAAGLRTALIAVFSVNYFGPLNQDAAKPGFGDFDHIGGVDVLLDPGSVDADITFFHHPAIFQYPVANPFAVQTERAFLVTHHPLFKGDGSMEFDPLLIQKSIRRQFGIEPVWAPISGLCRAQYMSMAPLLSLSAENWPNTFDTQEWVPNRRKMTDAGRLIVGRHGRPHRDKWPTKKGLIEASLPADSNTLIRVMGAPIDLFDDLSVDYAHWDIVPFKGETPQAFLDSLDVFSYFHAPNWVEAFGRTIAEAMLMGVRCILPHALKTNFGPHAHYCHEAEVPKLIEAIRNNLEHERAAALEAQDWARRAFTTESTLPRLQRFKSDSGSRKRNGETTSPPFKTARKLIGIKRRNQARFGNHSALS